MNNKRFLPLAVLFLLSIPSLSLAIQAPGPVVPEKTAAPVSIESAAAVPPAAAKSAPVDIRLSGLNRAVGSDPVAASQALLNENRFSWRMRDAYQETRLSKLQEDRFGYRHVRLDQVYQGLPVVGSQIVVHVNREGVAYRVDGRYLPDINISTTPSITADQAGAAGLALFAGKPGLRVTGAPELVVYPEAPGGPALAWRLVVSYRGGQGDAGCWVCYLDANTGGLIHRYNDIEYIAAPTTGGAPADIEGYRLQGEDGSDTTVHGWHETTDADTYYLYDKDLKWYVFDYATGGPWSDPGTYAYRIGSGDWGATDRAEISAAGNFQTVQNYFKTIDGRNSYDNAGAYVIANVHYGTNYLNAFWDPAAQQLYIGDGGTDIYGNSSAPLGVLDVLGHEFSHAWTQYTSGLIEDTANPAESGALNESMSDVMGTSIELATQPDGRADYPNASPGESDWLIGEDCWLSTIAVRDMRNPGNAATVGASGRQPSRYHGAYWDNLQEVHQNDGVQNFFYYLLSEGGSGTNDGLPYNVTGIGIAAAAQVAYNVNTNYFTPSETYYQASQDWLSAAAEINPAWEQGVRDAWAACGLIGVPASPYEGFETLDLAASTLWSTGGNAGWSITTSDEVQGSKSARSGTVGNNGSSWLQWTGYLDAPGTLSFFVSVSSEKNYDWLIFSLDGVEQTRWSGTVPWTSYCAAVPDGIHTLRWTYAKDTTLSAGSDAAYVDALNFSASVITYTITASAGSGGAISPEGAVTVSRNSQPLFTITPNSGYYLASLLVDGGAVDTQAGNLASYTFAPVTAGHTISAGFAASQPSGGGGGGGGGGGPAGPLAAGLSALVAWWKRRRGRR